MRWDFQQHCQNPLFICWNNGKIGIFDFQQIFLIKSNLNKCFNFQLEKSTFFINNQTKCDCEWIFETFKTANNSKILLEIPSKKLLQKYRHRQSEFYFFHWLIWLRNFSQGIFHDQKILKFLKKLKIHFLSSFCMKNFHLNSSSRSVTKRYSYNLEKWKTFNFHFFSVKNSQVSTFVIVEKLKKKFFVKTL